MYFPDVEPVIFICSNYIKRVRDKNYIHICSALYLDRVRELNGEFRIAAAAARLLPEPRVGVNLENAWHLL